MEGPTSKKTNEPPPEEGPHSQTPSCREKNIKEGKEKDNKTHLLSFPFLLT
jgi:ubiquitin